MNLLQFFIQNKKRSLSVAILLCFISGICTAAFISLVSVRLTETENFTILGFLSLALLLVFTISTNLFAKYFLTRLTVGQNFALRIRLIDRILASPYSRIEAIGAPRLYSLLSEDVQTISSAFSAIPQFCISLAITMGCIAYLCFVSPMAMAILLLIAVPIFFAYRYFHRQARKLIKSLLKIRDRRFRHYEIISSGYKELVTNQLRRKHFYNNQLLPAEDNSRKLQIAIAMKQEFANTGSQLSYFIFSLTLVLLVSTNYFSIQVVTSYALIALFMRTYLNHVLGIIPVWTRANVTWSNITALNLASPVIRDDIKIKNISRRAEKNALSLKGVDITFAYEQAKKEKPFKIGPLNFQWTAGEIVFITGENGSGKTSFLKVLVQLYPALSGSLHFNDIEITSANLDNYLDNISITFADSYLFGDLLLHPAKQTNKKVNNLIHRLQLNDKVSVVKGKFSTTSLSHGQRKRLSLLSAYMDNRDIFVFDEWADNQDPDFKRVFYREMLPELRAAGKLVIVVSHDDQYFDIADKRLIFPQ